MTRRPADPLMPLWIAMLLTAGAAACAPGDDPRIIATFGQGDSYYGYSSRIVGANYTNNPPTLVGGHVYIGTSRKIFEDPAAQNYFFKLDANLRKVWEFALGPDEVRGGATLDAEGRIYFVVEKGRTAGETAVAWDYLYCLSNDGALQWRFEIVSPARWTFMGIYNPAVAADGTIYVGGQRLYALTPSGAKLWEYPASLPPNAYMNVTNAPIIDPAGNLYFATSNRVVSLRPDGTERWVFRSEGGGLSSPAFSVDYGRIYVPMGRTLHAIDAATGAPVWAFTPPGMDGVNVEFRATPAVDDLDNVYVGSHAHEDSVFYAVGADGTLLWQNRIGADLYSSPALGDDRAVYVGSEKTGRAARFHALDMETGAKRWSVEIPDGDITWSSPVLSDAGVLYVGSMGGHVYAIRSDAARLLPGAGSPRFHGGNASTGRRSE